MIVLLFLVTRNAQTFQIHNLCTCNVVVSMQRGGVDHKQTRVSRRRRKYTYGLFRIALSKLFKIVFFTEQCAGILADCDVITHRTWQFFFIPKGWVKTLREKKYCTCASLGSRQPWCVLPACLVPIFTVHLPELEHFCCNLCRPKFLPQILSPQENISNVCGLLLITGLHDFDPPTSTVKDLPTADPWDPRSEQPLKSSLLLSDFDISSADGVLMKYKRWVLRLFHFFNKLSSTLRFVVGYGSVESTQSRLQKEQRGTWSFLLLKKRTLCAANDKLIGRNWKK